MSPVSESRSQHHPTKLRRTGTIPRLFYCFNFLTQRRPHRNRLSHGKPPQFAILNHAALDSGIPTESATQRIGIRQVHQLTLMCRATNATMRSNMSPVFDRSGGGPAGRSASIYSGVVLPPAFREFAAKR